MLHPRTFEAFNLPTTLTDALMRTSMYTDVSVGQLKELPQLIGKEHTLQVKHIRRNKSPIAAAGQPFVGIFGTKADVSNHKHH